VNLYGNEKKKVSNTALIQGIILAVGLSSSVIWSCEFQSVVPDVSKHCPHLKVQAVQEGQLFPLDRSLVALLDSWRSKDTV